MADYYNNGLVLEQANEIADLRAQLAAAQAGNDNARSAIAIWEQTAKELRAQLAARDADVGRLREAAMDAIENAIDGDTNSVVEGLRAALKGEG